jgi:membrane associated rhomboid family serine protease
VRRLTLTNVLVVVNVLAFVWQTTTRGGVEYDHGYLIPMLVLNHGEWWRIVSAAFLHANVAHIGLNMIALFSLGREVEALFGKARFALLYAVAVVGSGLAVVYFATDVTLPTLGASGAIYGLFGALVAAGLRLGRRGRTMIMSVIPVLVLNLAFTFSVPGISWQAHVGGLITGFVAGLVLFMGARGRRVAYAYAYAAAPGGTAAPLTTIEPEPDVETIEQPPDAGPHEEADAPPLHVRDPRE